MARSHRNAALPYNVGQARLADNSIKFVYILIPPSPSAVLNIRTPPKPHLIIALRVCLVDICYIRLAQKSQLHVSELTKISPRTKGWIT